MQRRYTPSAASATSNRYGQQVATCGTGLSVLRVNRFACAIQKQKPRCSSARAFIFSRDLRRSKLGAVEWIRTTTVLLPPAPQAGASASSATTAHRDVRHLFRGEAFVRDTNYRRVSFR